MVTEMRLSGLVHDNPLAFLALCGLLKTLENKKNEWNPRIAWIELTPWLYLSADVSEEQLMKEVMKGFEKYSTKMKFNGIEKLTDVDNFKKIQESAHSEILASLGFIWNSKKKSVKLTPLCMMFGTGHQYFLTRLKDAVSVNEKTEQISKEIRNTLFSTWKYKESKSSFRWDPKEYRPHAYRDKNPSGDPVMTVDGANRLAAIGFTVYLCIPTSHDLEIISYKNNEMIWPIWGIKLTMSSIMVLLRHPYMRKMSNDKNAQKLYHELRIYGVECIMASKIFKDGKYNNIRPPRRIM